MRDLVFLLFVTSCFNLTAGLDSEFYVPCKNYEKQGFEEKTTWNGICTSVCQSSCSAPQQTLSNCSSGVNEATCGLTSTCIKNQGCVCKSPIVRKSTEQETVVRGVFCRNSSLSIRLDKCALKAYGFGLADTFIGRPEPMSKKQHLRYPPRVKCYGRMSYSDGPEYRLSVNFSDRDACNISSKQNATHLIFSVGVHAFAGQVSRHVDRSTKLFATFQCAYRRKYNRTVGKVRARCSGNETMIDGHCVGFHYYAGRMLVKNMEFDDRLDDPRTPFYFDTKSVMENVIIQLFLASGTPVHRVIVLGFDRGSVVVRFAVQALTADVSDAGRLSDAVNNVTSAVDASTFVTNDTHVDVGFLSLYEYGGVDIHEPNQAEEEMLSNPCYLKTHTCHPKAVCQPETSSGYTCACMFGFVDVQPSAPGRICHSVCHSSIDPYCHNEGLCIVDAVAGTPSCLCQAGHEGIRCDRASEAHKISFYALPWVTAALLLVAFVVLLFIYIRRSNYLRKDFASQSLIPDSGPSNSDAVVGLLHHGSPDRRFLE